MYHAKHKEKTLLIVIRECTNGIDDSTKNEIKKGRRFDITNRILNLIISSKSYQPTRNDFFFSIFFHCRNSHHALINLQKRVDIFTGLFYVIENIVCCTFSFFHFKIHQIRVLLRLKIREEMQCTSHE